MEKRRHKRYPKRLKVRYGDKALAHGALTADVSLSGMFIATGHAPPLGSRLHIEVTLEDARLVNFEGVVARQVLVAPELRQIVKGGFAARFLSYAELLGELVPHLKDKNHCVLIFASLEQFQQTWDSELSRGGAFVALDKAHPSGTVLNLEIELTFAQKELTFPVKVMHVAPQPDGHFGTALMFVDAAEAKSALSPLLGR